MRVSIVSSCPCPACVQRRLIEDACRAEELFGLDELERFAAEQEEKRDDDQIGLRQVPM